MARRTTGQAALQERLARSFQRIPAQDVPRIFRMRLAEISPNPNQPRKHIDEEALKELASSIGRHGLIQPITVKARDDGAGYVLVAGERRFRAHQLLGRDDILAIVTQGAEDEIALIENLQRQDLRPLEESAAYARMMQTHGWTQEQLAEAVGKARPTITNMLKLNDLTDTVRAECEQRTDVSKSLLFEIARQDDPRDQERLWAQVRAGGTVRDARRIGQSADVERKPGQGRAGVTDPLGMLAARARRFLEQVRIVRGESKASAVRRELDTLQGDLQALLARLDGKRVPSGASKARTPTKRAERS